MYYYLQNLEKNNIFSVEGVLSQMLKRKFWRNILRATKSNVCNFSVVPLEG